MANLPADQDLNALRTSLHNYGLGNWVGKRTTTPNDMLRIAEACVQALDQFDRYEAELATIQGIAATRNVNLAQIAYERDCAMVDVERQARALAAIEQAVNGAKAPRPVPDVGGGK